MAAKIEKKQISGTPHSRANDVLAVAVALLAVLLFLCLISYSETDPSLVTASSQKTQNWIGIVGANIAAILFNTFGLTTYFLPFLLGLIGWRIFRAESFRVPVNRAAGYILFVLSVSGLFALAGIYGGIVGVFIGKNLPLLIGKIGSVILLAALLLTAILLVTSVSFAALLDYSKPLLETFGFRLEDLKTRFAAWRESRKQFALERQERRREMREVQADSISAKPTISNGENPAAKVEKPKTNGRKISEILKELDIPVAEISEKTEDSAPANEEIIPTISSKTESYEDAPANYETDVPDIPITPMKATGELENFEVESPLVAEAEEVPLDVKTPAQSFDDYILPPPEFLTPSPPHVEQEREVMLGVAQELTEKTKEFNVTGRVMHICQGPVVTTYEFKPDPGVKYSRITGLSDDLCLALKAESIRIDRIPGKAYVGIEVPNYNRETIALREVVESAKFKSSDSKLTIALGKSIDGLNYVADLAKMPHLLIAGATGAGKSVGVNTLVVSILYKAKPDEVKFIMVDPKRLELGLYQDIPHLATPIITDPKRAAISLKWAVGEMEKRYKDLAGWGVRNIDGFNAEVKKRNAAEQLDDNGEPWKTLPYIVIIIDELADLMMVSGKEVEESITRLAQMARAVGIHLVLATQRPSVDVITGLIKANFPARISFRVSSKVDSRTIIDANGAERLLGKGDMLFLPPATSQIVRVHGAFVDEKEIAKIVEHIKAQGKPEYDATITKTEEEMDESAELPGKKDPLFWDAVRSVVGAKRASTSLLQRHLRIGYGRAAAILDAMVREGYIGEMDGSSRARPILQAAYEALEAIDSGGEI